MKLFKKLQKKKTPHKFPILPPNDWGMPSGGEGMLFSWIYDGPDRVRRTIPSTSVKTDWSWNSVTLLTQSVVDPPVRPALTGRVFFQLVWSVSQSGWGQGRSRQTQRDWETERVRDWPVTTWSDSWAPHGDRVDGATPQRGVEGGLWWVRQGDQRVQYYIEK